MNNNFFDNKILKYFSNVAIYYVQNLQIVVP